MNTPYKLKLKSVSSGNFKILFEVLKDILVRSINIVFTKDYMKIIEVDGLEKAVVHLQIDSSAFQQYYCEDEQIKIGVNIGYLFKMTKVSTSSDTISFLIKRDEPNMFIVRLENSIKNRVFESSVKLLNLDKEIISIDELDYGYKITLQSIDFQNTFKNLNSLGDHNVDVEIRKVNNQIIFSHTGDFSDQRVVYLLKDEEIDGDSEIVQGIYDLKFLLLFSKSYKINTEMNLYLTNDKPLIVEYNVADLGSLRFLLSQQNTITS